MKDWNKAEESLHHHYNVTNLPDCIESHGRKILSTMILSPCASYVMFEDNRKSKGYKICRQCKYHLSRVEIPTMVSANNNMYGVLPKYLRDLSHIEVAFISQLDCMVMYLLIWVGNNNN